MENWRVTNIKTYPKNTSPSVKTRRQMKIGVNNFQKGWLFWFTQRAPDLLGWSHSIMKEKNEILKPDQDRSFLKESF